MHAEKEKRKNKPYHAHWEKRIFLPCLILFVLFTSLALFAPSFEEYNVKTSLDAALLPTAEYLLEHPQPEYEGLEFQYSQTVSENNPERVSICVTLLGDNSKGDLRDASDVFLNGSAVRFAGYMNVGPALARGNESPVFKPDNRCGFELKLELGIHLIGVRMKYRAEDEPFHIHQWAVEIK